MLRLISRNSIRTAITRRLCTAWRNSLTTIGIDPLAHGRRQCQQSSHWTSPLVTVMKTSSRSNLPLAEVDDAEPLADQVGEDGAVGLIAAFDLDFHFLARPCGPRGPRALAAAPCAAPRGRRRRG